jgi:serine/threonine-protein kinase
MALAIARPPVLLQAGDCVGSFRLVERIGAGGMGEVFLAEHALMGRRVALKVLHARHLGNARAYERFVREARLANRVRHPRVVEVTEIGHLADGRPWLAMEHVDGADLHSLWDAPLTLARFYDALDQILDALEAAHAAGVVHRDLKPSNIHLTRDGFVKLLDFGAARSATAHDDRVTETGEVIATARYMSPEQATGEPVDVRSDLYSLGVIMWELLVGRMPFVGHSFGEWVLLHATKVPAAPSRQRPMKVSGVPVALDAIVLRCLAKRADQRFASARELRVALQRARAAVPKRRMLWIGAAVAIGLIAILPLRRTRPSRALTTTPAPATTSRSTTTTTPTSSGEEMTFTPVILQAPRKKIVKRVRTPDAHSLKNPFGDEE